MMPRSKFPRFAQSHSAQGMLLSKLGLVIACALALTIVAYSFILSNADNSNVGAISESSSTPVVNGISTDSSTVSELETDAASVQLEQSPAAPRISSPAPQQEFPLLTIDAKDESAQLAQAKAAAEAAERFNQQKLRRLHIALTEDASEVESLAKIEISYLVNQWRAAWAAGRTDAYLSFYSDQFVPEKKQSLEQWHSERRNIVGPSKTANIHLSNFKVSFDAALNTSDVEFDQHYVSGAYDNKSRKKLVFAKETQGWKLISEVSLDNGS